MQIDSDKRECAHVEGREHKGTTLEKVGIGLGYLWIFKHRKLTYQSIGEQLAMLLLS